MQSSLNNPLFKIEQFKQNQHSKISFIVYEDGIKNSKRLNKNDQQIIIGREFIQKNRNIDNIPVQDISISSDEYYVSRLQCSINYSGLIDMRNFLQFIKGKYRKKSKNYVIRNFTIIFLKIKNFLNYKNTITELGSIIGTFIKMKDYQPFPIQANENYLCGSNLMFSVYCAGTYDDLLTYNYNNIKDKSNINDFAQIIEQINKYFKDSKTNFNYSVIPQSIESLPTPTICVQFSKYFKQYINIKEEIIQRYIIMAKYDSNLQNQTYVYTLIPKGGNLSQNFEGQICEFLDQQLFFIYDFSKKYWQVSNNSDKQDPNLWRSVGIDMYNGERYQKRELALKNLDDIKVGNIIFRIKW